MMRGVRSCGRLLPGGLLAWAMMAHWPTAATAAATEGAALFQGHCTPCHGPEGRGDGPDADRFDPPPRNLRSGFLRRVPVSELVERIRHGSPMSLAYDPKGLHDRTTDVDALIEHLRRLPTTPWRVVERGEELWVDRCEVCHGVAGKPPRVRPVGIKTPPDLSDGRRVRALDNESLARLIRHGRKGMPALVPRVSAADVAALSAYLQMFSPGHQTYNRYCATCHGEDGHPGDEVVEGMRRPGVVFDQEYFAGRDDDQLRLKVWHMVGDQKPAMPHFARRLSDAQVRAIVQYLRALPVKP
jgi:mono/diheme cytochrome c family protein